MDTDGFCRLCAGFAFTNVFLIRTIQKSDVHMTAKAAKQTSNLDAGVEIGAQPRRLCRQLCSKLTCEHGVEA